ncbi:MAG: GNAT family N-acetyltransferase [Saprospiraceae bacterium]|nr:GNAT family N-acetyltransferase [Saprospiraceae bacterium]
MTNRTFTPFPILVTERLTLRALSMDDEQGIFALRSDSEINKYLDRTPCETMEEAGDFIQKISGFVKKNESVYWAITLTEHQSFVGTICLFGFTDTERKCEIGYELLTDFQGRGIMSEAIHEVIEYAFKTLKIRAIEAFCHKDNKASIRLLETFEFVSSSESGNDDPDYWEFTLVER